MLRPNPIICFDKEGSWIPAFVGMTYGGIGITPGKQGFTGQAEKGIGMTCKIKGRYRKSIK